MSLNLKIIIVCGRDGPKDSLGEAASFFSVGRSVAKKDIADSPVPAYHNPFEIKFCKPATAKKQGKKAVFPFSNISIKYVILDRIAYYKFHFINA